MDLLGLFRKCCGDYMDKKRYKEIVDKHPDQSILAVSHAGALMTFLHAVEPERAFESCPGNCAILVFDYDGFSFHFVKLIDPIADQELVEF